MGWRLQEGVAFDAGSTGDRGSTGDTGNSDDTNVICQSSIVNPVRDDSGDLPVNQVRSRTSLLLTRPQQISIHVHGLLLETRMRCSHCRELLCVVKVQHSSKITAQKRNSGEKNWTYRITVMQSDWFISGLLFKSFILTCTACLLSRTCIY